MSETKNQDKTETDEKTKAKGKKVLEEVDEPAAARGSNVIDLMAALKNSVGGRSAPANDSDAGKTAKKAPAKKAPAKKAAAKKTAKKAS